jgi:DNA-binding LytR/AlgR family response regulator
MLEVMIVDDEPVAVRRLAALLGAFADVTLVGTAGNAAEAIDRAAESRPDLVLLDIEMPGMNGIGLADRLLGMADPPAIVFVTAFGRFALDAFDLAATDYLVKPVEPARLAEAIERVRRQRASRDAATRIGDLDRIVERLRRFEHGDDDLTLWLPDLRARDRVRIADVQWIAAERDYVRVHVPNRSYLVRGRIGELAAQLEGHGLLRVHRSALVRIGAVARIEHRGDRSYRLVFGDGRHVDASRRFATVVREAVARAAS